MKVLIACEYSGIVRSAFEARGHNAWSCDLLKSEKSGGQHITGDVKEILNENWDLIIAHPPCTYLCNAGQNWINKQSNRRQMATDAIKFVKTIWSAKCPSIAIENPKGILSTNWRPPEQIIYPWYFGSPYRKDICLWLKNLPPLIATCYSTKRKSVSNHTNGRMNQEQKSKIKSRFFPEVAEAMATQWG